jgi:aerobic carbon-monoxide dehydrogenase medium subunit
MIAFEYRTPGSLEETLKDLNEVGSDGKLIAGGTALVIMMKQQLLQPTCVISLRNVSGLSDISANNGSVHIGGLVSHAALDDSSVVQDRLRMLAETYHHVATQRVRTMATVGGGLAHADPNQDPPPALIALGATFEVSSASGVRTVAADQFFTDYYETVLEPTEVLTGINVPVLPANTGAAYLKFLPRSADDYATVSAAAVVTLDSTKKKINDVRIAMGSVNTTPVRATEAENLLKGQPVTDEGLREAGEKAKGATDPVSDFRGSASYKTQMAGVFVRRALERAIANVK